MVIFINRIILFRENICDSSINVLYLLKLNDMVQASREIMGIPLNSLAIAILIKQKEILRK